MPVAPHYEQQRRRAVSVPRLGEVHENKHVSAVDAYVPGGPWLIALGVSASLRPNGRLDPLFQSPAKLDCRASPEPNGSSELNYPRVCRQLSNV